MPDSTSLPLEGIGVLVTRARDQAAELVSRLETLGASVYAVPAIDTEPLPEPPGLRETLYRILEYENIIFTSVNGVTYFLKHLETAGMSPAKLPPALCAGPRTAEEWLKAGGTVHTVPEKYTARDLVSSLGDDLSAAYYLVLRPEQVRTDIAGILRQRGARVDEVILYRTVFSGENAKLFLDLLNGDRLDAILFASPSAIEGILWMAGGSARIRDIPAICIGPTTARAAMKSGLERVAFPEEYTVDGMIGVLLAAAEERKDRR